MNNPVRLLLLFSLISISSFGQITLTEYDFAQAGSIYLRTQALGTSVDYNSTGADYNWDFSSLSGNTVDTMNFVSVSNTPVFYQFLFNSPLNPDYRATEGQKTEDISVGGQLDLTNIYLYTKTTSSYINEVGMGTTISGIPLPTTYDDIKTKLVLPLNYGDANSDDYEYTINIPTLGALAQKGTLSYSVDGWGTLTLPSGSFAVLRVKTEIQKTDSIYINMIGNGITIPSTETIYEWYTLDGGYPLVKVTETFGIPTSFLFADAHPLSTQELSSSAYVIYPSPTNDFIQIDGIQQNAQIMIWSATGQLMNALTYNSGSISVENYPSGAYFIHISEAGKTRIEKFVKQ